MQLVHQYILRTWKSMLYTMCMIKLHYVHNLIDSYSKIRTNFICGTVDSFLYRSCVISYLLSLQYPGLKVWFQSRHPDRIYKNTCSILAKQPVTMSVGICMMQL